MSNKECIRQVRIRSDGLLIKGRSISGKIFVLNPIKLMKAFNYNSHFAISAPLNSLCVGGGRGGGRGGREEGRPKGHPFDC